MKILFLRHGESHDDLIDAYGGWADYHLTDKGCKQVLESSAKIANLKINFDAIISSPLKRARESAQILADKIGTHVEIFEYIKERNTYGILCGMVKSEAKQRFPWLVEALEKGEFVDGSEREEDIKFRVKKAFELILKMPYENIILVTHGVFLKYFFAEVFAKKLTKKEDAGFIYLEVQATDDTKLKGVNIVQSSGIEIE